MRIALVGYGKMGRAVERVATARQHRIVTQVRSTSIEHLEHIAPETTDVVIEFTHPGAVVSILQRLLPLGVPVVVGTTGWYHQLDEIRELAVKHQTPFLYGANFSIGVNIFFKVSEMLSRLMQPYADYDCWIEDRHHNQKADSPSGTALRLAQGVMANLPNKTAIATAKDLAHRAPHPHELSIGSVRTGPMVGQHTLGFVSSLDSIEITHRANQREGFAMGAVVGAEWLMGKKGFFEFSELFEG